MTLFQVAIPCADVGSNSWKVIIKMCVCVCWGLLIYVNEFINCICAAPVPAMAVNSCLEAVKDGVKLPPRYPCVPVAGFQTIGVVSMCL